MMLRDPINLGVDGFRLAGEPGDAGTIHLGRGDLPEGPSGCVLEKEVRLPPGYRLLRLEGPGAANARVSLDDQPLQRTEAGVFLLPPILDEEVRLEIAFEGAPEPLHAIWVLE